MPLLADGPNLVADGPDLVADAEDCPCYKRARKCSDDSISDYGREVGDFTEGVKYGPDESDPPECYYFDPEDEATPCPPPHILPELDEHETCEECLDEEEDCPCMGLSTADDDTVLLSFSDVENTICHYTDPLHVEPSYKIIAGTVNGDHCLTKYYEDACACGKRAVCVWRKTIAITTRKYIGSWDCEETDPATSTVDYTTAIIELRRENTGVDGGGCPTGARWRLRVWAETDLPSSVAETWLFDGASTASTPFTVNNTATDEFSLAYDGQATGTLNGC